MTTLRWIVVGAYVNCDPDGEVGEGAKAFLVYSTRPLAIDGRRANTPGDPEASGYGGLIRPLWPKDVNEVEEGGNFFLLDKETKPELFTPGELRREHEE